MAAEDGWRSVIHECKEDGIIGGWMRITDRFEGERGNCQVEESVVFGW